MLLLLRLPAGRQSQVQAPLFLRVLLALVHWQAEAQAEGPLPLLALALLLPVVVPVAVPAAAEEAT